jgi:hypothetical protein
VRGSAPGHPRKITFNDDEVMGEAAVAVAGAHVNDPAIHDTWVSELDDACPDCASAGSHTGNAGRMTRQVLFPGDCSVKLTTMFSMPHMPVSDPGIPRHWNGGQKMGSVTVNCTARGMVYIVGRAAGDATKGFNLCAQPGFTCVPPMLDVQIDETPCVLSTPVASPHNGIVAKGSIVPPAPLIVAGCKTGTPPVNTTVVPP